MKKLSQRHAMAVGAVALMSSGAASAIDITSGDWKFSLNGNVNVHYIYTKCESGNSAHAIAGGLACAGDSSYSSVSNISNGLLPAAFSFGVATTQKGLDVAVHLGLYPGISSNDGGSPNLQAGSALNPNTGLATTGLDVRQVYTTIGNKDIGTFMLGRNFGLFGFDAIINDMTIPGVGAPGAAASAAPANTTLGSIGLGYIYTDTFAQMNYTTPTFAGFNATIGIFQPLNEIGTAAEPKSAPGVHGKATYTIAFSSTTKLYLSSSFLEQKQKYNVAGTPFSYEGYGIDAAAKLDVGPLQVLLSPYYAKGLGTTALFLNSSDGAGGRRSSDGLLAQVTYKVLDDVKLGVNYGISRLRQSKAEVAGGGVPGLVKRNSKITGGVYYSLTPNVTLLSEVTAVQAKNEGNQKNDSIGGNVGAFVSF